MLEGWCCFVRVLRGGEDDVVKRGQGSRGGSRERVLERGKEGRRFSWR